MTSSSSTTSAAIPSVDVDPNGAGGDFTTVFSLIGTTGLDIGNLVADGNVQLEPPTS